MRVSGTFIYQAPTGLSPAAFMVSLFMLNEDGSPLFPAGDAGSASASDRVSIGVHMGYPQVRWIPLATPSTSSSEGGLVLSTGLFSEDVEEMPAEWRPAALIVSVDDTPRAIITAALPAPPDTGIEKIPAIPHLPHH